MIEVVSIDTPALGDRSYLAIDGRAALVVDPQRAIDRVLATAARRGVAITHVLETHIHNDYVSGGLALSRATGASYGIPAGEPVSFADEALALKGGDKIGAGRLEITVIETAGHTNHHLAYLVGVVDDTQ